MLRNKKIKKVKSEAPSQVERLGFEGPAAGSALISDAAPGQQNLVSAVQKNPSVSGCPKTEDF